MDLKKEILKNTLHLHERSRSTKPAKSAFFLSLDKSLSQFSSPERPIRKLSASNPRTKIFKERMEE